MKTQIKNNIIETVRISPYEIQPETATFQIRVWKSDDIPANAHYTEYVQGIEVAARRHKDLMWHYAGTDAEKTPGCNEEEDDAEPEPVMAYPKGRWAA